MRKVGSCLCVSDFAKLLEFLQPLALACPEEEQALLLYGRREELPGRFGAPEFLQSVEQVNPDVKTLGGYIVEFSFQRLILDAKTGVFD